MRTPSARVVHVDLKLRFERRNKPRDVRSADRPLDLYSVLRTRMYLLRYPLDGVREPAERLAPEDDGDARCEKEREPRDGEGRVEVCGKLAHLTQ